MNGQKTYVLVGGGSGGHITPLVAVAEQLKHLEPACRVVHIGHKGDRLNQVTRDSAVIDEVHEIAAGKFRRYHGESFFSHVIDVKTLFFNTRDFFRVLHGYKQARKLLKKLQPDNIMMKGGYVCVPAGVAAHRLRMRFFTHDSDVTAGLANKIIARWAYIHTRGMPLSKEQESSTNELYVGVPLQTAFRDESKTVDDYKQQLHLTGKKVVFVVGGGLGARNINVAITAGAAGILADPQVHIIHITGQKLFEETKDAYEAALSVEIIRTRVTLLDYTTELHMYSGAADVVVTRAGATNLAEFAAQGKACIVVPNPVLTGGQQLHNAEVFSQRQAIVRVDESSLQGGKLASEIIELLKNDTARAQLSTQITSLARKDAAAELASILIDAKMDTENQ